MSPRVADASAGCAACITAARSIAGDRRRGAWSVERMLEIVGDKAHDFLEHLPEVVIELLIQRVVARVEQEDRILAGAGRLADVEAEPLLVLRAHADDDQVLAQLALRARAQ